MIQSSLKKAVLDGRKFYKMKFSMLLINYYMPGKIFLLQLWALQQFLASYLNYF